MTDKPTIEDCMEQAQIFAITWSLVGRRVFGTTMENATAEKEALEAMLRAALAAPAQPEAVGEPVFAFRRKGLDDFCTCTGKRYAELSLKPNLFETCIFYTAPQPAAQAQPVAVITGRLGDICTFRSSAARKGDAVYLQPAAQAAPVVADVRQDVKRLERERICAAIKAEDDYCVEHGDYMLDSDDCIKIVRGEWKRPDFAIAARAAERQP